MKKNLNKPNCIMLLTLLRKQSRNIKKEEINQTNSI